jgi:hypothetical protein
MVVVILSRELRDEAEDVGPPVSGGEGACGTSLKSAYVV